MTFDFDCEKEAVDFVAQRTCHAFWPPMQTIGVRNSAGEMTGAFIFNEYTGYAIQMSMAGRGAMSRGVWAAVAHYVFVQIGCVRLEVTTRASNTKILKFAEAVGFTREGIARRAYGDEDGVMLSVLRDEASAILRKWRR